MVLRSITKTEAVYSEVRWQILTGELRPGATLKQDGLARDLGVSVTPVREALRRLESEGLVKFMAHSTVRIPPLSLGELEELYNIRLQLDPYAAKLAATTCSRLEADHLFDVLRPLGTGSDARDRFEANRAFHRAVYYASGNKQLGQLLDQLWDRTERYRFILIEAGIDEHASSDEHLEIARAISDHDARVARDLLKKHVQRAYEKIKGVFDEGTERSALVR
jgi:DNA-binding GntR family transcriptional regulator